MAYQSKYEKASKDIYQEMTDTSINALIKLKEAMENNDGEWTQSWVSFGAKNLLTDKKYKDIKILNRFYYVFINAYFLC